MDTWISAESDMVRINIIELNLWSNTGLTVGTNFTINLFQLNLRRWEDTD